MEDDCSVCHVWDFPTSGKTSQGFRLVCADCGRPLAKPNFVGNEDFIPQVKTLQSFESALVRALNQQ